MVQKPDRLGTSVRRANQSPQPAADEMPVVNDIAKRFEQLETQWLSFQRKAATKPDETAASLASTPHFLSSSQERLEDTEPEPASRECFSNFTFPVAVDGALLKTDRACAYRTGGKASKVRARRSLLAAPRMSTSPRSPAFFQLEQNPAPAYSSLRKAAAAATPASTESSAPVGQRGTVSFAGFSGRAPNPAQRNSVRASLADQQRIKTPIPQHRCSSTSGRRGYRAASRAELFPEPNGGPVGPGSSSGRDTLNAGTSIRKRAGYNAGKRYDPPSERHGEVKQYLRGDVGTSTPAASDPATYSSGKGPPPGDDRLEDLLDVRDASTMATSPQPAEAPNSVKDQCRVGGSFEEHTKRLEHERNTSPWDRRDYLAPDSEEGGHDFEAIERAMVSDVQEIPPFAKAPRNVNAPQKKYEQRVRSNNFFPTQEQIWLISRQKHEKGLADASLGAVETGKAVLRKLLWCLKEILQQFEHKDKALQDNWQSLAHQRMLCSDMKDYAPGYAKGSLQLDDLSLLAQDASPENWSGPVIAICKRLVSLFGRETHLQKWAVALERETAHLLRMEDEMAEMKTVAAKEAERVSRLERLVEEKCHNVEEERLNLAKERETLSLWVGHLQERRKAVSECEKEAAASLAEVQKRSANLFVRESAIDGRALEIATLQEEVRIVSQRLHEDLELITKEKTKIQEKLRQVVAKEVDVEAQMTALTKMQQDVLAQSKKLEHERALGEEQKNRTATLYQEMEEKLVVKENMLHSLQKQVEAAKLEAENARQSADDARACIWEDRQEADEYITSMEVRLREWEGELTNRELELLHKQEFVKDLERSVIGKQELYQVLHQKVLEEQQKMSDELNKRELTLAKKAALQDQKCADVKRELDKLRAEKENVNGSRQLLSEMESRICTVSRGLQAKHEELLKQVHEDVKQYSERMEELETMKWSLKSESIRGFEELSTHKQALRIWQNELEGSLEEQIRNIVKDKAELEAHIDQLNKMQLEMESVGSQVLEHIQVLEQTAAKLEERQQKVEVAHSLVKESAGKLMKQQDLLLQREAALHSKESNLLEAQTQLKRLAVEAQAYEVALKVKEQALINGENNVHVMEVKLEDERKSFTERVLRFKQHVSNLEKEAANTEETLRSQAEALGQKERALAIEKLSLLKGVGEEPSMKGVCHNSNRVPFSERERQALEVRMKNVDKTNVESWKRLSDEQGTDAAHKEAFPLTRTLKASFMVEQLEDKSGIDFKADEPTDPTDRSDLQGQLPHMSETARESGVESCDAGLALKKLLLAETGRKLVARTDQRDNDIHDIKDFWQRLRTSRLDSVFDGIGSEERKRAIENLLTSLAKTDNIRGRGTARLEESTIMTERLVSEDSDCTQNPAEVCMNPTRKDDDEGINGGKNKDFKRVAFSDKYADQEAKDDDVGLKEWMRKPVQEEGRKTTANLLSTISGQLAKDLNWMKQISPRCETDLILEHQVADAAEEGNKASLIYAEGSPTQQKTMHRGPERCREEDEVEASLGASTARKLKTQNVEEMLSNGTYSGGRSGNSDIIGCKENPAEGLRTRTGAASPDTDADQGSPHRQKPSSSFVSRGLGSQGSAYHSPLGSAESEATSANVKESVAKGLYNFNISANCGHLPKLPYVPEFRSHFLDGEVSSQHRLESVMIALHQASQESRRRLVEARNGLRSLPPSVAVVSQAEATLEDLAGKLTLMEQIEEGLANQLDRASMLQELPNKVDQAYVDRVQLLNRLQDQQRLRAEWEEDMHQHMESIESLLHCHSSPQKLASSLNRSQLCTPSSASRNHRAPWQMLGSSLSGHRSTGSAGDWTRGSPNSSSSYGLWDQSRPPLPRRSAVGNRAGDENGVPHIHSYYGQEIQHRLGDTTDFRSPAMNSRRKLLMSPLQKNMYASFNK